MMEILKKLFETMPEDDEYFENSVARHLSSSKTQIFIF